MAKRLNKAEAAWIAELQEVLDRCPSTRLGFFTIGDPNISIYDRGSDAEITKLQDTRGLDFGPAASKCNARLGEVIFPSNVHSTAG